MRIHVFGSAASLPRPTPGGPAIAIAPGFCRVSSSTAVSASPRPMSGAGRRTLTLPDTGRV